MKLILKRLGSYISAHWRLLFFISVSLLLIGTLLLFRLGSLTNGLSTSEVKQAEFASSWRNIAENPLHLPLTFVQWIILTIIPHHGNTVTRAASPIFGIAALVAFGYVLRRWYGFRSAVYGVIIFGLSAWFLHVSRYASTDVLYLWALPTLLAVMIAWDRHQKRRRITYGAMAALAFLLYIPGLIWFVIAALLLQPQLLINSWKTTKNYIGRSLLILLPFVLLIPLFYAFARTPSLIQTWLGLPQDFGTPEGVVRSLLHSFSFFVYKGPDTPELWLARAPILSFFSTVMALLGVLFYSKHLHAPRTRWLITFFVIGALLFAIGGPVKLSILVPLVYLFVTAGVGYLIHEWLQVFPRNPLARSIGYVFIASTVAISCAYNLKAYYIAWPHNTATKAAFQKLD